MSWIESHQSLLQHPKLLDLSRKLNCSLNEAIGMLHRLWWWTLEYAEDGDLSHFDHETICIAISSRDLGQTKDGLSLPLGEAISVLCATRWLDDTPYLRIHDWWDYAGKYLTAKYHSSNRAKLLEIMNKLEVDSSLSLVQPLGRLKEQNRVKVNLNLSSSFSSEGGAGGDDQDALAPEAIALAKLLAERIQQNFPNLTKPTDARIFSWAEDADKIHRLDKHEWIQIQALIEWAQEDSFWRANILSMSKLRKQWNQLTAKKENGSGSFKHDNRNAPNRVEAEPGKYSHLGRRAATGTNPNGKS